MRVLEVEIEKLDHYGRGITKIDDKICFVENALPNETVEIKIEKETKKYLLASTSKIIKQSKDRVTPPCPYYQICGGCNLEHLSFEKENRYKKQKVQEIMEKFAKVDKNLVQDTIYNQPYHYRNKIILHNKNNQIGLYERKSNQIIPIEKCYLVEEKLNEEIKKITLSKEKDIVLRIGNKTEEILNQKKNTIKSYIGSKQYQISKESFFQVNSKITEKLYDEVKEIIKNKHSKNVLDLYCGTGTISIYIHEEVNKVLGIESCKEAVEDAKENIILNKAQNCTYQLGKVEDLTKEITRKYDTAIIDPPRKGLNKKVVDKLLEITPNTLIYISCDPVTLARDLNLLKKAYRIDYIRPYNMFPRTYHIENLVLLTKK